MNLLSGNEAIARGAWEAGCHIGAAYPGTPSTETMESFAKLPGVYAEWCPNEKVALEVAVGASAAGARVLVTMKHVGVKVCADPLFTAAYTGVNGGLVILVCFPLKTNKTLVTMQWLLWFRSWNQQIPQKRTDLRKTLMAYPNNLTLP